MKKPDVKSVVKDLKKTRKEREYANTSPVKSEGRRLAGFYLRERNGQEHFVPVREADKGVGDRIAGKLLGKLNKRRNKNMAALDRLQKQRKQGKDEE